MYGILLILVLIVMGGAIAYIGDKLGSKVGKKKLSVFGLRPKHTSILVTIITGILITSSTLGVMALTSENVRVALFGMEKLNQQIRQTQESLGTVTAALEQAKVEREETLAALNKAQEDYKMALDDLNRSKKQVAALEETKNSLEAQKGTLEQRVSALSAERAKLESDISRLTTLTKRLSEGIQFVREGVIVYRSGEVITTAVLPYEGGRETVAAGLTEILGGANQLILERLGVKEKLEAIWLAQSEFEAAVTRIQESRADVVVRIVAAGNIVYGEPVRAHIELFENRKIYEKGQQIFSEDFAYTSESGEVGSERMVIAFLKAVNVAATEQGMIPDPLRGSVGVMNGAQFYDIVNEIEPMNGTVRLTAYALDDTNASGPLRLRIKVEQVK